MLGFYYCPSIYIAKFIEATKWT